MCGICFLCFAEIDNCDSQPCRNGGKCSNAVNSYKCACAKGYLGSTCEIGTLNNTCRVCILFFFQYASIIVTLC